MKTKIFTLLVAFMALISYNVNAATVTVGATGTYPSIAAAVTGLGTITEPVVIELTTDYAQTMDSILVIPGADATNTVTIRPQGALIVAGNGAFVWKMKGCQFVTIDGRVGGAGASVLTLRADTLVGTTTTTVLKSTIALKFEDDAAHNTVQYLNLKGATTVNPWRSTTSTVAADRGTITFGAGIATGNSYNTIDNCDLGPIDAYTSTPTISIYSTGTSGFPNTNLTISNCKIYDYFSTDMNKSTTAPSSGVGVYLGANTTACTVSGNSFYQTLPRAKIYTPTTYEMWGNASGARSAAIAIFNTSGSGFIVKNNYIGGSEALCAGSYYKAITGNNTAFNAIYLNVSPGAKSFVYGNTIKNLWLGASLNQTVASQTSAINLSGSVWVGVREDETTADGNTIGDQSAATVGASASIIFNGTATNGAFSGIVNNTATGANVKIANNKIAGIYVPVNPFTATFIHYLVGVNNLGGNQCTVLIDNNEFGNSDSGVAAASMSLQNLTGRPSYGVLLNAANATSTFTISNNKISNIYAYTSTASDPGQVFGIMIPNAIGCPVTINNNEIRDLVYTNKRSNNTGDCFTSSGGIVCSSYGNGSVISNNKIYNIQGVGNNSYNTNGISLQCMNTAANVKVDVYNNLIYNIASDVTTSIGLQVSGTTGINTSCSGPGAGAYANTPTYNVYNNIIRLGYNRDGSPVSTSTVLIGIRDTMISNSATAAANYYNNTIYIGGTGVASTVANPSFGMCFATYNNFTTVGVLATLVTRTVKNNLIINERSNETTGGGHYAIGTGGTSTALANFTANNNNYLVTGTGGVLGRFTGKTEAATFTELQSFTGDANSITVSPVFINATATTPDLHLNQSSAANDALNVAATIALITTDFDGDSRAGINSTIGADEYKGPGTGLISKLTPDIFVSVSGENAIVNGVKAGDVISVYTLNGLQIKQITAKSAQASIKLNTGVYLIKVNSKVMKVIM